jgi:hypothetical protein
MSAISNNNVKSIAIDNWCTPEISPAREMPFNTEKDPKDIFLSNIKDKDTIVIDSDINDIPTLSISNIDVLFYDGDHSKSSHLNSFKILDRYFNKVFIAIIDDYNWPDVREGMELVCNKYKVLYKKEIFTSGEDLNDFWNGLGIYILEKN